MSKNPVCTATGFGVSETTILATPDNRHPLQDAWQRGGRIIEIDQVLGGSLQRFAAAIEADRRVRLAQSAESAADDNGRFQELIMERVNGRSLTAIEQQEVDAISATRAKIKSLRMSELAIKSMPDNQIITINVTADEYWI